MHWKVEGNFNNDAKETVKNVGLPFHYEIDVDGIIGGETIDDNTAGTIFGRVGPFKLYKSYWLQEYVFNKHKMIFTTNGLCRPDSYYNTLAIPSDIELSEEDKEKIVIFMLANSQYRADDKKTLFATIDFIPQGEDEPMRLEDYHDRFLYALARDENDKIYPAVPITELKKATQNYEGIITKIDGDAYIVDSSNNKITLGITGKYVIINDRRVKCKFVTISLDSEKIEMIDPHDDDFDIKELARKYSWAYKNREHYKKYVNQTLVYSHFSFLKPGWRLLIGNWSPAKI